MANNMETQKKTLFVDGCEVEFTNEKNLLQVIRKAGIEVPTFCYRPDLSQYGACRMCVVEVEGRGIQSSCTMPPEPGLKVHVNTERTRRIRKMVVELLLANHDRECTTCERSGDCELQFWANKLGIKHVKKKKKRESQYLPVDDTNPSIVRNPNKCILCGACVRACNEIQGLGIIDFANRGSKTVVAPAYNKHLGDVDCIFCGQCVAVCPVGALTIKSDVQNVWDEIVNPQKQVVCQIAPAVRVALGEAFGLDAGENSIGLIVAALKKIGFDKVFDTNFAADLTIMEEATEFVTRFKEGKNLPIFTSCCPAWVRFLENHHPDMLNHLSTCRSPQQMFGSLVKDVITKEEGISRDELVSVSIMPCTAKKAECKREEFYVDNNPDVDYVLTTHELISMIKEAGIDFNKLEPQSADSPYGLFTGAGTIFGASGGVAEAAARTAYEVVTGKKLEDVDIKAMRGANTFKSIELDLEGTKVKVVVVNTIKEAEEVLQKIKSGELECHILEVMACPGGCIGGGGQPISCSEPEKKLKRAAGLYEDDAHQPLRKSHDNPAIQELYKKWLEKPNSHKAHELLHTHYKNRFETSYKNV